MEKEFLANASKAFESDNNAKENKKKLEKLKEENDALTKALGRTTVERGWAVGKLKILSTPSSQHSQ